MTFPGDIVPAAGATRGADQAYDTHDCVADLQAVGVAPHLAQNITAHRGGAAPDAIARPRRATS